MLVLPAQGNQLEYILCKFSSHKINLLSCLFYASVSLFVGSKKNLAEKAEGTRVVREGIKSSNKLIQQDKAILWKYFTVESGKG